jgi:hypothetical protein
MPMAAGLENALHGLAFHEHGAPDGLVVRNKSMTRCASAQFAAKYLFPADLNFY